jgi:two-component system cell cycle sensor histidine kinase/response regulator CckA
MKMKRSPLIPSATPFDPPRTQDIGTPNIDCEFISDKVTPEQSPLSELQTFGARLRAAEDEARIIDLEWKTANAPLRINYSGSNNFAEETRSRFVGQKRNKTSRGRGLYDYDLQSVNEEVLSNIKEVQSFNDDLDETARTSSEPNVPLDSDSQGCASIWNPTLDLVTSVVEVVREPLVLLDNTLLVRKANRAFYRTFDETEDSIETYSIYDVAEGAWDIAALRDLLEKVLLDNRAHEELEINCNFPEIGPKCLRMNARRLSGGAMILMSIRDVTPRRRTEVELDRVRDELRQGQKMEVIGRLAGGVAHDFNNILTGILGFSELLMEQLPEASNTYHQAAEIKKASERAAALTQQLLAFSRRQVLRPQIVSLNAVILDLNEMLHRLMGDDIELHNSLDETLQLIHADPGQLSQVILNLAINARDAMPQGGRLSIRTENIRISETGDRRHQELGEFVSLVVSDSGTGMDIETQRHIFEPFYTTKPQGSGTGLGLATVFGIVEQSGGSIRFASELGYGTTFWIDFPRAEGTLPVDAPRERVGILKGSETVLVVEDDDIVRELVVLLLEGQGYTVLSVGRASEALELFRSPITIDLLLTDLLMPGGMDGRELAEETIAMRPGTQVLLMSGYTTDALVLHGVGEGAHFLQKPFTQQQLAIKVRDVLDNSQHPQKMEKMQFPSAGTPISPAL